MNNIDFSFDSKLYPPGMALFSTREEAVAYALEVEGYHQLWDQIVIADLMGVICVN